MTREDGFELSDTFGISWLQTAEEGSVDVGGIGGITVSLGNDSTVYTSGVAVPDFNHGVGDGVAGGHVDNLSVKNEFDSLFFFDNVCANILARDVYI